MGSNALRLALVMTFDGRTAPVHDHAGGASHRRSHMLLDRVCLQIADVRVYDLASVPHAPILPERLLQHLLRPVTLTRGVRSALSVLSALFSRPEK